MITKNKIYKYTYVLPIIRKTMKIFTYKNNLFMVESYFGSPMVTVATCICTCTVYTAVVLAGDTQHVCAVSYFIQLYMYRCTCTFF